MQGEQLSPLLYNVYTDDLNHHLQATGVGCYVGGAWVNSLSYADDIVLFAPTVTRLFRHSLHGGKKQFRRQNAVGNMLVRKFSFAPLEAKIQLFKSCCYPFMDVLFGVIHSRTLLENLLSVIVTHSSVLLTPPDT